MLIAKPSVCKKGRTSVDISNCIRNTVFSITAYPA
jgi:hypothetical protein